MALTLQTENVLEQVKTLNSWADSLVIMLGGHNGRMDRSAALTELSRNLHVPLSDARYALSVARSSGKVVTTHAGSTIELVE
ncbi:MULTISPECIES: hypothetical protein [Micrococcaceae]|uniref:hypothetical protein n=1 Tax=Micrococcaceae TaxID=1268 RepID=UPI0012E3D020|nr:hypothetical protein [Arthrobacter sp. Soil761]